MVSHTEIENAAPSNGARRVGSSRKPRVISHDHCQNCGEKLVGDHCHACGQHGHVHRTVLHVIEEVFHGITHVDGRAWRSLPMLAFRPGTLTRNYVMGKRTYYVPPFAMFLFSVFAMFLVFALSGGPNFVTKEAATKAERVLEARTKVSVSASKLQTAQSDLASAQRALAIVSTTPAPEFGAEGAARGQLAGATRQLESAQRDVAEDTAALAAALAEPAARVSVRQDGSKSNVKAAISLGTPTDRDTALAEIASEKAQAKQEGDVVAAGVLGAAETAVKVAPGPANVVTAEGSEDILEMLKDSMRRGDFITTPWPELNKKIKHKTENPDLFLYKLQNTAYKFSFLFVPLSLPFLWLMLFWKKNVTLYDHAVFALYSLSFLSFLFMLISLSAHWLSLGLAFGIAAIIMPIHIFFQFKGAYQLGWFSAFWRMSLFCGVFSWVVMLAFLLSITALGVTG